MQNKYKKIYKTSEDIAGAAAIAYSYCKNSESEDFIKIRPVLELIYKKADSLFLDIIEFEDILTGKNKEDEAK